MVTFQNTEQRHKKYIKQTIIDKFKVIFSDLNCQNSWITGIFVLASIATFLRYRQGNVLWIISFSILWKR
jgi:hypothetical protein